MYILNKIENEKYWKEENKYLNKLKTAKKRNAEMLKSNAQKYKKINKARFEGKNKFIGLTYVELLETPQWKEKRMQILKRDKFTCLICKSKLNLHVHHRVYESFRLPWQYKNNCLATLCEKCHKSIHSDPVNTKIMEYEIAEKIGNPNRKMPKIPFPV